MVDQIRKENRADLEAVQAEIKAARAEIARLRATDDTAETEHDPPRQLNQGSLEMSTDPKVAYLAGVLDGFRLARAETQDEAEELIAESNKADVDGRRATAPPKPSAIPRRD